MIRKMEDVVASPVEGKRWNADAWAKQGSKMVDTVFNRWGLLLYVLGFLLGRAMIIGELSPFAIPFFAVVYHLRRDKLMPVGLAVVIGAMSHALGTPLAMVAAMFVFIGIQKLMEQWGKGELSYTPLAVLMTVFITQLTFSFFVDWNTYQLMLATVEAGLSFVLTLIFVQSLPLVTTNRRSQPLKNEEVVCVVILLASVMTGTVGWLWMGLSLEHILARYAVLVFALAAGGAIGATVGVVTGIILSLANIEAMLEMSLLAFSGLLGGLLKEGKKVGVAIGLLVGTLLMGLYVQDGDLWATLNESLIAILLFLLTPKSVFLKISRYIPGTHEHDSVQQDYIKRLRDVTASKVDQFSTLFGQLSKSFSSGETSMEEDQDRYADLFLSQVTQDTCQVCFKKKQCWQEKFEDTYELMHQMLTTIEAEDAMNHPQLLSAWNKHCVKSKQVIEKMETEIEQYKANLLYKQKMKESRRLVAEQLSGVSQVMNNFAREIEKEGEAHHTQEQQLLDALENLGLSIRYVEIISLEEGNIDIEMSQPMCHGREECVKIVAPLVSDIVGEQIMVADKECDFYADGYCKMRLVSAQTFKVESGVSSAAKGGGWLSGDNFNTMNVGGGKHAVAIADGMGNGERAYQQSNETLTLLQQILQSGIEETVAIKSVNSVLSLRSTEEIFSTLDLAMIDLQTAHTKFLKIGSTPSFIKRGERCVTVSAHNLPIGIIQDIEVDVVSQSLKAGDLLIMITDGIYDAPRHIENKERWMRRMIAEITTDDPQEVADLLLEKVIRFHHGHIDDDMTVVVSKIERNIPDWSTISTTGIPKIKKRRKKERLSS